MTKKEFNNWIEKCDIDKDCKYTSLLSTNCLYEFYKEAIKEQLRIGGVSNRRELLFAYEKSFESENFSDADIYQTIDYFLSK